jgi:AcrR family transcriptional regulator
MATAVPGRGDQPKAQRGPHPEAGRPDPPRARILTAASALFSRAGIRAVGVDAIIAAAGVAKASFYRHFRSKDELVTAWLRDQRTRWLDRVRTESARRASSPEDELLVYFDVVIELLDDPDFYGCPYLNTAAELRDAPDSVRHELVRFINEVEEYLEELARRAGLSAAKVVASELRLISAGSFALLTVFGGDSTAALKARQAASAIIDAAR